MATSNPERTPGIGLAAGTSLYVCAILGAGVLVLPGQAASLAGPASLLAWGFSALIGLPLAFTFAALASAHPDDGGVATYSSRAFSPYAGAVAGWWYFIAGSVGQTIVPLTAGYYVADAAGLAQRWAPAIAALVLAVAVLANLAGLRVGARLQLALAMGVAAILVVVIAVGLPHLRTAAFRDVAPHGLTGVGSAVVVLFYAFAGWETIAHLSAEFRDVERTLPRATALTVGVVTVLYLGVATVVVGTGSYGAPAVDRVALGVVVEHGVGVSASTAVAVASVVICLGTTNAFVAAVSRLGFALARDGWAPRPLLRRNAAGAPSGGVLAVAAIAGAGLVGAATLGWGTDDLVVVPSVLVLVTYLLGTLAAARLFAGRRRTVALLAFGLLLLTVPFAGWHLVIPLAIATVVAAQSSLRTSRQRSTIR